MHKTCRKSQQLENDSPNPPVDTIWECAVTFLERAANSANSLASDTVTTVSSVGTALAEAVVSTTTDLRTGIRTGRVRPATVAAAAAIGAITVVEFPILVAIGGAALIVNKLMNQSAPSKTASS
jgi:hypothetical protein